MVIPSDQLSIAYFCKRFLSLPLLPYFFHNYYLIFVAFFKPTLLIRFDCQLQIGGTRSNLNPEAICPVWFSVTILLWSKPVFINPARFSTTSCQYITNYDPAIINPVWFDYKLPILYMVNPVFIKTRYGLLSTGTVWKELSLLKIGVITLTTKNW